jgi:hypothetical protein
MQYLSINRRVSTRKKSYSEEIKIKGISRVIEPAGIATHNTQYISKINVAILKISYCFQIKP